MSGLSEKRISWSEDAVSKTLENTRNLPGPVLISLQEIQRKFGYVRDEDINLVAEACNVSRAEVYGVLTFYRDLRRAPPPKHLVQICVAEACQSVGSRTLVIETELALGSNLDEIGDHVEIRSTYCLGNCALGPACEVDGELIGRATSRKISSRLMKMRDSR